MKKLIHVVVIGLILALIGWKVAAGLSWLNSDGEYPEKPIAIVVPYDAGGGVDSFVRPVGKVIADEGWLDEPLVVLNQPGGSGTIGSRFVKDGRPDGYRILCHHESIITAELSGAANFGPEDFEVIAQTGDIVLLVIVREDAPFGSIVDLLDAAKQSPEQIRFGANIGSPAHFTAMSLEAAVPGAKFNLVSSGGGQTRYISIIGGHLEAGIFSLAEYLKYRSPEGTPPDKNVRVLAVLSEEPHPILPGVKTCVEDGIDVTSSNAYYWWAPKGTPQAIIDTIAGTLEKAMKHPEVRERLAEQSIAPTFTQGEVVRERLARRLAILEPLKVEAASELPDFPVYLGIVALGLLILVVVSGFRKGDAIEKGEAANFRTGAFCLLTLLSYVLLLEFTELPFSLTSMVMVFVMGGLICGWEKKKLPVLVEIALLSGLGSEFIFGSVFGVTLP